MTDKEGVDVTIPDGGTVFEDQQGADGGDWTATRRFAVVMCDGAGTITGASQPFVDRFVQEGTEDEIVGSSLDDYLVDGETAALPRLAADDAERRTLRLSTADGNDRRVTFEAVPNDHGSAAAVVGIDADRPAWPAGPDTTRPDRAQSDPARVAEKRRLLSEVCREIGESASYRQGLERTLRALCTYTEWTYGEVWTPATDGEYLEFTYGYTDDPGVEAFRAGSESVTFAFGEGLPGRVYESASTEWIPDASSEPTAVFHRAELAADAGLRAAFGVPITADGEVVTVLAFFLRERRERDERLAADVHDVVSGLGGLIERTRTEERVRERNQQLEAFAEVVSHDLRNPLNVATGALSMVADECESEYVETVAAAHERMQELITDVLTLARQGKTVDAPETVALAAVVGDCWETVETGGATLQVETDAEILADRSRLRQLVENLLRNAVDHGGPTVTVTVGSLPTGFYIQDDGPGFGEVDCETVFELGATTADDGTGLGLAIVREIAEAHGWQVEAVDGESGARFEVTGVERR